MEVVSSKDYGRASLSYWEKGLEAGGDRSEANNHVRVESNSDSEVVRLEWLQIEGFGSRELRPICTRAEALLHFNHESKQYSNKNNKVNMN